MTDTDYPDWLKPRVPAGHLFTYTYKEVEYDFDLLRQNYTAFINVYRKDTRELVEEKLFVNSDLLSWEVHGKWLGLGGVTIYSKTTEFELHDLDMTIEQARTKVWDVSSAVYLGANPGGWQKQFDSYDFQVDFTNEVVIYDDGKQKTFAELFYEADKNV
jgi:hypothetical protein